MQYVLKMSSLAAIGNHQFCSPSDCYYWFQASTKKRGSTSSAVGLQAKNDQCHKVKINLKHINGVRINWQHIQNRPLHSLSFICEIFST